MKLGLAIAASVWIAGVAHAERPRPRILIDPGHGGTNRGAVGGGGLVEKDLTLDVARRVQRLLVAKGADARLTRDRDRTLTLRQRVAAANAWPADLFVSVHANASPARVQRGFETFVLTPAGVDIDGRALRSDAPASRPGIDPEIGLVLDDIERGAVQWEAAELAASVQAALRAARGRAGDRGVRQDAHHVLLGATMPAVLIEIGFLDHPIEGAELADPAVRERIAIAIADAVAAAARSE